MPLVLAETVLAKFFGLGVVFVIVLQGESSLLFC